ncbi:MAG TPA: hypothetical protein VHR15_11520 [Ktedonobacterales bacterium]|jgi:hypothetical protein|nr:hypothetical protein [Ktedonobacterales bacterium]
MSSPNDPTDPNISRAPEYPPQPEYYAQAPGYPTYAQGNPPTQPAQPYPYPQPAPQPYPPYQPYPGQYAPPPMPPKRSNRTLWIVLGSVGGALLLLCVVCSVLAVALGGQIGKQLGPVFGASTTLVNFCTAMQEQDYATAYAQFSTDLQGRVTEDEFTSNATKLDADQGRVTNCSTSSNASSSGDSNGPTISDDKVTLNVGITRSGGATNGETTNTTSGSFTFTKAGSNFKIDEMESIFELT